MVEGEVVAILDDFIGKTVVVRHPGIMSPDGDVFHTLLSHIQPQVRLLDTVTRDRILGRVGKSTNAGAPAHLHLTGAWIPNTIHPNEIRMDHIHPAFSPIVLTDFQSLMHDNPLLSMVL